MQLFGAKIMYKSIIPEKEKKLRHDEISWLKKSDPLKSCLFQYSPHAIDSFSFMIK